MNMVIVHYAACHVYTEEIISVTNCLLPSGFCCAKDRPEKEKRKNYLFIMQSIHLTRNEPPECHFKICSLTGKMTLKRE